MGNTYRDNRNAKRKKNARSRQRHRRGVQKAKTKRIMRDELGRFCPGSCKGCTTRQKCPILRGRVSSGTEMLAFELANRHFDKLEEMG